MLDRTNAYSGMQIAAYGPDCMCAEGSIQQFGDWGFD